VVQYREAQASIAREKVFQLLPKGAWQEIGYFGIAQGDDCARLRHLFNNY